MKFIILVSIFVLWILQSCNTSTSNTSKADSAISNSNDELIKQLDLGKHLVKITGCSDCHTPKKMTSHGPVNDSAALFAGCISLNELPDISLAMSTKGIAATTDQTAWNGPWGKSFAANISSDPTGIGGWSEKQFINCLRKGRYKGLDGARPLMPPMPWQDYSQMSDAELKAIFAYLKSTKPVHNIVPEYQTFANLK